MDLGQTIDACMDAREKRRTLATKPLTFVTEAPPAAMNAVQLDCL